MKSMICLLAVAFSAFPAFGNTQKAPVKVPAKVVKSPSDRTCLEHDGKLECTPNRTKHRAQNTAGQHVSKAEKAGTAADEASDGAKAADKADNGAAGAPGKN